MKKSNYEGIFKPTEGFVTVSRNLHDGFDVRAFNGMIRIPNYRKDKSPTGFEIGYAGSGPSALAYSILADVVGKDHEALDLIFQRFKWQVVSRFKTGFRMLIEDVEKWVKAFDGQLDKNTPSVIPPIRLYHPAPSGIFLEQKFRGVIDGTGKFFYAGTSGEIPDSDISLEGV